MLNEHAVIPQRKTKHAIGLDLASTDHVEIEPGCQAVIGTGLGVEFPEGYYGWIASRSGLASRGIVAQGGIIDPDYTGEIKIILYNHSDARFVVHEGNRIAQLIVQPYLVRPFILTSSKERPETERGTQGLGSTGTETDVEETDCLFCGA